MNLASWIILAILIVIMALALRSSLSKRKKGGCCNTSDGKSNCACHDCKTCESCSIAKNALQPTIVDLDR